MIRVLTALFLAATFATAGARKPNIIYVMVDDLGYGDLGCYGQKTLKTPHLDKMASQGMKFTDHYSGHTVCRPSRLVLWLGQHVGTTKVNGNIKAGLTGKEMTIAKKLNEAGYTTGGVGKWALGHVSKPEEINNPGHPNNNGFDYWFGYMNQSNAHNFYPTFLWENKTQIKLPGNVISDDPRGAGRVASKKVTYSHHKMVDRGFEFIRKNKDNPFLLHMHWTIPHTNNEAGRVTGDGQEVPDYGIYKNKDWPNPEKGFAAMITMMDDDMGKLFKLLQDLKIDNDTLVIFTSDNGPHHEGGHKHDFFDSNGPLKGHKRSMHDGGIRVPFIARWPGKIEAATTSDLPSAFWDFLPTACEIAGTDAPKNIDGISYLPTLLGKSDQQKKHNYLYWSSREGTTSIGVRHQNWKLVKYRETKANKKKRTKTNGPDDWRLYDISKDPGEENDLYKEKPELVLKIKGLVERDKLLLSAQRK